MKDINKANKLKVRLSAATAIGGRNDLEDRYSIVHYHAPKSTQIIGDYHHHQDKPLEHSFLFLGIFDGHGGNYAAQYVCQHLCKTIVRQRAFWSNDDEKIKLAIHRGFIRTHKTMLNQLTKWPRSDNGYPSTSGTTASIVFIMNGKYYTGHVGDSKIVLGRRDNYSSAWTAHAMTIDHKPESPKELSRIESSGGRVMPSRSGIRRVVWNRPRLDNHNICDVVPFLAVARSLGDFWSYHPPTKSYVVSPEPDVNVTEIDPRDKCLILASDGLWNVLRISKAVKIVRKFERVSGRECIFENDTHASTLLSISLSKWAGSRFRADNVTVLVALLDQFIPKTTEHSDMMIMNRFLFPNFFTNTSNEKEGEEDEEDEDDEQNDDASGDEMIGRIIHSIDYDSKTETINAEDDLQIPNSIKRDVTAVIESLLNRVCHDEDIYHTLIPLVKGGDENQLDDAQLASIDFDRFLEKIENKSNYICEFILDKTLIDTKAEEASTPNRTIFQPMMNSVNFLNEPQAFNYFPYDSYNLSRINTVEESAVSDNDRTAEQVLRTRSLGEIDLKRNSSTMDTTFGDKDINSTSIKVGEAVNNLNAQKTFVRPRTSSYTDELTSAVRLPKLCFKRKTYLEQLKLEEQQCKHMRIEVKSDNFDGDSKEQTLEDEDNQLNFVYDADEETSDLENNSNKFIPFQV